MPCYKVATVDEDRISYYWSDSYPDLEAIAAVRVFCFVLVFLAQQPPLLPAEEDA